LVCKMAQEAAEVLKREKHIDYVQSLDSKKESVAYWVTEHLRMSGVYWGLSAMALLNSLDRMDRAEAIAFVKSCQVPSGAFAGNHGHDGHILYTLSAVQVLCMFDALDEIDIDPVASYILATPRAASSPPWSPASSPVLALRFHL